MKLKVDLKARREARDAKRSEWRQWFAWHPVKTPDSVWVWLERVDRRGDRVTVTSLEPEAPCQIKVDVWRWKYRLIGAQVPPMGVE